MITLAGLAVFIYTCAVEPLFANSEIMGKPLNVFEPYIAALNSGSLLLIIPLGFLAISSDFPLVDRSTMSGVIRTGRVNWFFGQLMDLFMMCAAYLLFIFAASVIPTVFGGVWGMEWSEVAVYFGMEFPEYAWNFGALLLPKNLYNQLSLFDAAVQSTVFVFIYLVLLGMILLFFTTIGKKTAGVIVCGGVITAGSALCSINSQIMWALPTANSIVWLHYTEFRREPVYPVWCSYAYFGALLAVLTVISFITLKKMNFTEGRYD